MYFSLELLNGIGCLCCVKEHKKQYTRRIIETSLPTKERKRLLWVDVWTTISCAMFLVGWLVCFIVLLFSTWRTELL